MRPASHRGKRRDGGGLLDGLARILCYSYPGHMDGSYQAECVALIVLRARGAHRMVWV